MTEASSFPSRPDGSQTIAWRPWGKAAFEEAERTDRPVLLTLTAVWCAWCRRMDETTFSDPEVVRLVGESLVPVRVDADRYPHVQERYIMGGWPTHAFLTPTGEVLWAGTNAPPEQFLAVARQVLTAWRDRRPELEAEIARRRRALEAARARHPAVGLVRREAADDVLTAVQETFDPRNGGFGNAPKFPQPDVLELLAVHAERLGDRTALEMVERTLDGILAGELWDTVEGGFHRYALEPDWTEPRHEKILEVNAGLLRAYALGARLDGRDDWREVAERTVEWVEARLGLEDGLWGGSQAADEAYYRLDAVGRRDREPPYVDPVVYTDANASWIRALAEAGSRLGRPDWIRRAADALTTLLAAMAADDGLLHHFRAPGGEPSLPGLLVDSVEAARACVAVAQATGEGEFLDRARRLADAMEKHLWAGDGGFFDHLPSGEAIGALRYRDRPFDRNAAAARLFLDLAQATGERSYRAVAERTLALLSPLAGRYGAAGAEFALAVEEFFEPPLHVVVVGPAAEAAPLRVAALALPVAARRVWSLERGGRIGALSFPESTTPAAYVCGGHACSPPITEPDRLAAAVAAAR
jgi:hypothetical protein